MSRGYGVTPEQMAVAGGHLAEAQALLTKVTRALVQAGVPDVGEAEVALAVRQATGRLAKDAEATTRSVAATTTKLAQNRAAYASAEETTTRAFDVAPAADGGPKSVFG
ncbi:hypothetical protein AB0D04_22465 [Streptomyces sp. NPDC048483]|uniref:hypothetical protein n=1 Tax=Streptomyces sp. NPDC048483 TaxID=3154927 RepID=UPI003417390C